MGETGVLPRSLLPRVELPAVLSLVQLSSFAAAADVAVWDKAEKSIGAGLASGRCRYYYYF
jgi:hypothetical protein